MNITGAILAPANDDGISRATQAEAVLRALVAGLDAREIADATGDERKAAIAEVVICGAHEAARLLLALPPDQRD